MAGINIILSKISVAANAIKTGAALWLKGVARKDNTGNRVHDFSLNENHAELYTGRYLEFDGLNDSVLVSDAINGIKTACVWINPATTTEVLFDFDGGATTIYLSAGTVLTKGITSPTIYVDGVEVSTVVAGSWQLVVVTSETAWNATALTFAEEGGNYYDGGACYIKLFADALKLEDAEELYSYPEKVIPRTTQISRLLFFFSCMESDDVSGFLADQSNYQRVARIQGATYSKGAQEPAPQTAIQNSQKRVYSANDTYVNVPHDAALNVDTTGSWSLVARIWIRSTSGSQGIIVKDNLNNAYALSIQSGNIDFRGAGATGALTFSASAATVYNIVCTVEGGTTAKLYVNGIEEDTGTITAAANTSGDLQIMGYNSGNEFAGFLYYAAVYGKTLSSYQATDFANGKLPHEVDGGFLRGAWINEGVSTWRDYSRFKNTGTVNGTAGFMWDMEGRNGMSAMRLPFTNLRKNRLLLRESGVLVVSDDSTLDALTGVTVECWIKLDSIGAIQQILIKDGAYALRIQSDNTIRFSFWQGTNENTLDSDSTMVADTWYHIVGTYDGTDTNIYINGSLDKTTDLNSGNIDTNSNDILIGGGSTTPTLAVTGDMGPVRVYASGATALEVARNYRKELKLFSYG